MSGASASGPTREHVERFLVRSYEVEPDGRLRIVVLLRMLQETAWQHASRLGKGFTRREEGALFWVLSRLRLRMSRYPRWGERFVVRTFPVGTDRILAIRDFVLLDDTESVIGRATSGWLVVDGGRGRPVRPEQVVADIDTSPSEYDGDVERLPSLPTDPADSTDPTIRAVGPHRVRYHDIDQYRHVNNAAYLEWILDALDPDRPFAAEVAELAIDFLKETLLGDEYTVRLAAASPSGPAHPADHATTGHATTDHAEVVQGSTGTAAARARLMWRPLEE